MREKTLAVLFGGIGGFSAGALKAKVEYGGQIYKYKLLVSIDCDPVACLNHDLITGEQTAKVMDLFSRDQYTRFHGEVPPDDWQEVTPYDVWQAFGEQVPDKLFLSPPCKGLSGLLPKRAAESDKYQALNELSIRGLELALEACYIYGGSVPAIVHFENVPRITTRGKRLLAIIRKLLKDYGYAVDMNPSHNLGEIGGLGQKRIRFLIMARQESKVPNFVYQPPKRPLKTIGDIIGPLPSPGDTKSCGWMHRVPKLQWKTWVRLALIRAGGDWRDLNSLDWENYGIAYVPRGCGTYGVQSWNDPGNTVVGNARLTGSNGCAAVADPRIINLPREGSMGVARWDKAGRTVTASSAVGRSNGLQAIQDPRTEFKDNAHAILYRVSRLNEAAPTVTGAIGPSNGCMSISDPRIPERTGRYTDKYRIQVFDRAANTVTGVSDIQSGAQVIADPRLNCYCRSGNYGVQDWNEAAKTVTASHDVHAGTAAVADPRIPDDAVKGVFIIIAFDGTWHRPLTTYELAMLQSFPMFLPDGRPFQLEKCADAKAREYIGNAYPPDTGEAACNSTLLALAKADAKVSFELSNDLIWVSSKEQIPADIKEDSSSDDTRLS